MWTLNYYYILSGLLWISVCGDVTSVATTDKQIADVDYITVKKCCTIGKAIKTDPKSKKQVCANYPKEFDMEIYATNATNYWIFSNLSQLNIKFRFGNPCKSYYYVNSRENETFQLLYNGSLFISKDWLMENNYCVDNVLFDDEVIVTSAILCSDESSPISSNVRYVFVAFLLVSVIALSSVIYYINKFRQEFHKHTKYYLIGYLSTLIVVTFIMAIVQIFEESFTNTLLVILGHLIYYLILKHFIWLNMTVYSFYGDTLKKDVYNKWYFLIPFVVPIVFLIAGILSGIRSALPSIYMYPVEYDNNIGWTFMLFFIPIGCSLLVNVVLLVSTKTLKFKNLVKVLSKQDWNKSDANNINKQRRMFLFMTILTWLVYLCDIIVFLLPKAAGHSIKFVVYDVLRLLIGLFIALIFVKRRHYQCQCSANDEQLNMTELETLNTNLTGMNNSLTQ